MLYVLTNSDRYPSGLHPLTPRVIVQRVEDLRGRRWMEGGDGFVVLPDFWSAPDADRVWRRMQILRSVATGRSYVREPRSDHPGHCEACCCEPDVRMSECSPATETELIAMIWQTWIHVASNLAFVPPLRWMVVLIAAIGAGYGIQCYICHELILREPTYPSNMTDQQRQLVDFHVDQCLLKWWASRCGSP